MLPNAHWTTLVLSWEKVYNDFWVITNEQRPPHHPPVSLLTLSPVMITKSQRKSFFFPFYLFLLLASRHSSRLPPDPGLPHLRSHPEQYCVNLTISGQLCKVLVNPTNIWSVYELFISHTKGVRYSSSTSNAWNWLPGNQIKGYICSSVTT